VSDKKVPSTTNTFKPDLLLRGLAFRDNIKLRQTNGMMFGTELLFDVQDISRKE
jgi:hypothetical protein